MILMFFVLLLFSSQLTLCPIFIRQIYFMGQRCEHPIFFYCNSNHTRRVFLIHTQNLMHINDFASLRPSKRSCEFTAKWVPHIRIYLHKSTLVLGNRWTELCCRKTGIFDDYHFIFYLSALICSITFLPRSKLWCMRTIFFCFLRTENVPMLSAQRIANDMNIYFGIFWCTTFGAHWVWLWCQ